MRLALNRPYTFVDLGISTEVNLHSDYSGSLGLTWAGVEDWVSTATYQGNSSLSGHSNERIKLNAVWDMPYH